MLLISFYFKNKTKYLFIQTIHKQDYKKTSKISVPIFIMEDEAK